MLFSRYGGSFYLTQYLVTTVSGNGSYTPTTSTPAPADHPANQCGSIIHVDNQSVGEQVALTGNPFTLNYFSDRVSKANVSAAKTTTYTYDSIGNLKSVTLPSGRVVSYRLDGLQRRQARLVDGVVKTQYLYQDGLRVAALLDATGSVTHRFIYGSKSNVPDYLESVGF